MDSKHLVSGTRVAKKNGKAFSNGCLTAVITGVDGTAIWMDTGTFLTRGDCTATLDVVTENPEPEPETEATGGSSSYYEVTVELPTKPDREPYMAECNDIIEALDMTFAEANVFKATWRKAAQRQGNGKPGVDALYDANKCVFYSDRMKAQAQHEQEKTNGN